MKNEEIEEIRADDIDVDEEIKNTQRSWKLQKVAWVFILVMIGLLSIGLFGDGALSFQSMDKQQYNVQYDRYFRYQSEKLFRITSHGKPIKKVSITQSLTNNFKVTEIIPFPIRSYVENNSRVYEFNPDKNGVVLFYVVPMESGSVQGSLNVDGVVFPLKQFIYP